VPRHDVERRVRLCVRKETARELDGNLPWGGAWRRCRVEIECGDGVLKVADVGKSVASQDTKLGELEAGPINLEGVARRVRGREIRVGGHNGHGEADACRHY